MTNNKNNQEREKVGDKIKKLRKNRGFTSEGLALATGLSRAYISQLENNRSKKPSAESLFKIATALGVSMEWFFDEEMKLEGGKMSRDELLRLVKSGGFTVLYHDHGHAELYRGRFEYHDLPEGQKSISIDAFDLGRGYIPTVVKLLVAALGGVVDSI